VFISNQGPIKGKIITMISIWIPSPRFLSSDGFLFDLPEPWDVRALSIRSAHLHVSWLSDFIFFYPKPFYKSLHQSFFYSFITILPSTQSWSGKSVVFLMESALTSHGSSKSNKKPAEESWTNGYHV
jgi:hypothetical protein